MIQSLLKTESKNVSLFLIRITLALVILPHGAQKLLGVFGGDGFTATMNYFTETVGVPWMIGLLVILAETFGALFLLAGFLSRLLAGSLIVVMTGAASTHLANGFFMNWFGNQSGEGVEFFILAIAMAVQVTIQGAGRWSVDGWLLKNVSLKRKSFLNTQFTTSIDDSVSRVRES